LISWVGYWIVEGSVVTDVYTFRLPQEIETAPSALSYGRFCVRYAYGRSSDSQTSDDLGQDYIAFRINLERFAFVLCDGVSQSFYGDLAARVMGDLLLDWLWDRSPKWRTEREFQSTLASQLEAWTEKGKQIVGSYRLPEDVPTMVADVLERKRDQGSETMFVCGLLNLPDRKNKRGSIALAWMGDTRLQLWMGEDQKTDLLNASWDTNQRWSSHGGLKGGTPGTYLTNFEEVDRVIGYSDGFVSVEQKLSQANEADLDSLIQKLLQSPTSDDVSFIDLVVLPKSVKTKIPLLAPFSPKVAMNDLGGSSTISWSEIPTAKEYEISFHSGTKSTTIRSKSTDMAIDLNHLDNISRIRVRPVRGKEQGPWSAWSNNLLLESAQRATASMDAAEFVHKEERSETSKGSKWRLWVGAVALLFVVLALVVGGIWWIRNRSNVGEPTPQATEIPQMTPNPYGPKRPSGLESHPTPGVNLFNSFENSYEDNLLGEM
jgi:hypothetical protein